MKEVRKEIGDGRKSRRLKRSGEKSKENESQGGTRR